MMFILSVDEESEGHVITTSKVRARVKKKKTKAAAQVKGEIKRLD